MVWREGSEGLGRDSWRGFEVSGDVRVDDGHEGVRDGDVIVDQSENGNEKKRWKKNGDGVEE